MDECAPLGLHNGNAVTTRDSARDIAHMGVIIHERLARKALFVRPRHVLESTTR